MSTKVEATIEDLYKVEGKAELVNGEIVPMAGTGGLPHYAAREITLSLATYEQTVRQGYAIADNAVFVVNLPHRKSFSPDAGFYLGELTMKFFKGAFTVGRHSEDFGRRFEQARPEFSVVGERMIPESKHQFGQ